MYRSSLVGSLALALILPLLAAAKDEDKNVELKGKLITGVFAIGGETTGTIIETKEGRFELDFGKNKELRKLAEKLKGKQVQVAGTLTVRKGVEIKMRKIVTVKTLKAAEEK